MNGVFSWKHQIPIFEKGYEKDPAIVAKEAIQEASRNGSDVVLVDTAGRMQVKIADIPVFNVHIDILVLLGWGEKDASVLFKCI